jgi:hypothetical protein
MRAAAALLALALLLVAACGQGIDDLESGPPDASAPRAPPPPEVLGYAVDRPGATCLWLDGGLTCFERQTEPGRVHVEIDGGTPAVAD